jgi:hypothetical protein
MSDKNRSVRLPQQKIGEALVKQHGQAAPLVRPCHDNRIGAFTGNDTDDLFLSSPENLVGNMRVTGLNLAQTYSFSPRAVMI